MRFSILLLAVCAGLVSAVAVPVPQTRRAQCLNGCLGRWNTWYVLPTLLFGSLLANLLA